MTALAHNRNTKTALIMAVIVAAMIGLAFASVPLFRIFCEATGFAGTPQRAEKAPGAVAGQVGVRFDANVHPGLPWRFEPEQTTVRVKPGARTQIFYRAQNLSAKTITGQAVFNVSPDQVGKYFKKIQCFCFTEQTLKAGEAKDMPVVFFVDPQITKDPDTKDIDEITLSYTFYPTGS
ncbi:cytochrome c oxidase assembly protein [Sphingomonas sp. URHD0057]|uniref:cytochrome c oxidase assembly protein n=1 Tax=Sphingomonas sp. URHD0057 TaxID=1380389 RepID=UPI000AA6EDDE|nr:cytochrome c oxidase assembly protein [Sphingomonas sp. URHD0057]